MSREPAVGLGNLPRSNRATDSQAEASKQPIRSTATRGRAERAVSHNVNPVGELEVIVAALWLQAPEQPHCPIPMSGA